MNRELQKERTWWNIITSAGTCFFKKGIEKTSMASIAEDAGVATKTLERYFGSKQNLILALANVYVEHACQEILGEYEKQVIGMNGYERVRTLLQSELSFFQKNPHDTTGLSELEMYLSKGNLTADERTKHRQCYIKLQEYLTMDLIRGQKDGSVSSGINPEEMGTQMETICLSVVQRMGLANASPVNNDYLVRALMGTIKNEE